MPRPVCGCVLMFFFLCFLLLFLVPLITLLRGCLFVAKGSLTVSLISYLILSFSFSFDCFFYLRWLVLSGVPSWMYTRLVFMWVSGHYSSFRVDNFRFNGFIICWVWFFFVIYASLGCRMILFSKFPVELSTIFHFAPLLLLPRWHLIHSEFKICRLFIFFLASLLWSSDVVYCCEL